MTWILKLSSQRQLTLPKALVEMMGSPSYIEAVPVKGEVVLRKGLKMTLAEAELAFGRHGLTREVLQEALRIAGQRKAEAPADE